MAIYLSNGVRKKAKGKARKALEAKKEGEKEAQDDSSAAAAQQREQKGALEAQMQRLIIDSLPSPCRHGFDMPFPRGHICDRFLCLYLDTLFAGSRIKDRNKMDAVLEAMKAVDKKYPEVLSDSSKMKHILSFFYRRERSTF